MTGVGITITTLPFYAERLALAEGVPPARIALHVTALTAIYVVMHLAFAPLWGRLSDRVGRRPLIILGIAGFAASQILFGLATSTPLLYAARAFGGAVSAALLPAVGAYIADVTLEKDRARSMAGLGTAIGVGTLIGPALGGALVGREIHLELTVGSLHFDAFSLPFFAAAGLSIVAALAALRALPVRSSRNVLEHESTAHERTARDRSLAPLLVVAAAAQLGIMVFESTFALFAKERLGFGPTATGIAFTWCGAVMIPAQFAGVALARKLGDRRQIAAGFVLMAVGLASLNFAAGVASLAVAVTLLAAGMAFIVPAVSALVSKRARAGTGRALGRLSAAQSSGQITGAILGGALFAWSDKAAYFLGAALMAIVGAALVAGTVTAVGADRGAGERALDPNNDDGSAV